LGVERALFGPDSMMRRVNREPVLLLGARGTLLMQLAHPLVATGVAQHSRWPGDALGRLRRTLDAVNTIVFADEDAARKAVARVNALHARVRGVAPDGRAYAATDPRLLLWVHATLVDAALRVYEACVGSLRDRDRAAYYEDTKVVAGMFTIPSDMLPPDPESLRAWMAGMIDSGEVAVGPLARELARPLLSPLPWMPWRLARISAVATAALLPPAVRAGYGLEVGRVALGMLSLTGRASRLVIPRIPERLRTYPIAYRAGT
jgi:uncharacterized protein (DUF2236 family)